MAMTNQTPTKDSAKIAEYVKARPNQELSCYKVAADLGLEDQTVINWFANRARHVYFPEFQRRSRGIKYLAEFRGKLHRVARSKYVYDTLDRYTPDPTVGTGNVKYSSLKPATNAGPLIASVPVPKHSASPSLPPQTLLVIIAVMGGVATLQDDQGNYWSGVLNPIPVGPN